MIVIEDNNIKQYKAFITYALRTCDTASMIFEKKDDNKNGYLCEEAYFIIMESIIEKESVFIHPDTGTWFDDADIIYFKTDVKTGGLFMKANNFFEFDGNRFPEELCFYRKGKKWFTLVSHERIILLHNETLTDIIFLEEKHIQFHIA